MFKNYAESERMGFSDKMSKHLEIQSVQIEQWGWMKEPVLVNFFCHCDETSEKANFKGGNIYFVSWF